MSRILVVGLGKFGRAVAQALTESRADVIAIDVDLHLVEAARDSVAVTAQADATELESLRALGTHECATAVVAIGDDFKAAVLAVAVLKELGIGQIIARANNEREDRILRLAGAEEVLVIEQEVGRRVADRLARKG